MAQWAAKLVKKSKMLKYFDCGQLKELIRATSQTDEMKEKLKSKEDNQALYHQLMAYNHNPKAITNKKPVLGSDISGKLLGYMNQPKVGEQPEFKNNQLKRQLTQEALLQQS